MSNGLSKLNELTRAAGQLHTRVVTQHKISQIMFGGHDLPAHPQGRVLCAHIRYGEVYLYIEEPMEPAPLVVLRFAGFRDGTPIPARAQYVTSVFEHGDHAHIYILAQVG